MNIFLLGNGFDLHHMFPTNYHNFLHVTDFLIKYYVDSMKTVGDILGNDNLQENDEFISKCYGSHKSAYDNTSLNKDKISQIISIAKNNLWFSYLLKSFNKKAGWIDFEKEIAFVISKFKILFDNMNSCFFLTQPKDDAYYHVISHFDYFYSSDEYADCETNDEYTIEVPIGSGNYQKDKEKIIKTLYKSLQELSVVLKLYLEVFVDSVTDTLISESTIKKNPLFNVDSWIVTLNYTNTYEKIYSKSKIIDHTHGNVNSDIVLGINSDLSDELENIDTSFIFFKKYFQRVFYKTDESYIVNSEQIKVISHYDNGNNLKIIGHSLDETDKEIIKALFSVSRKITIYFYDTNDVGKYIKNLVKIYGKTEFDKIRVEKSLEFLPLEAIY